MLPLLLLCMLASVPAKAQQPGFDPRQTEKHFDVPQSGQAPSARSGLRMPLVSRPEVTADTKPMFVLRGVSLTGAHAIPRDQIIRVYQPYLGKKVSQADLAAIAAGVSDLYRAAGFHLSRAIVPPQDIRDGQVRLQVIEGSITEVALKGDGAEQFGIRPLLDPVLAEISLAAGDAGTPAAADQRPAGRAHRRYRAGRDRRRDRPFPSHRLCEHLAHLHLVRDRQSRIVVGRSLADLRDRRIQFLSRARRHAGAQSVDHARRSARACVRPAVLRCPGRHRRRPHRRIRAVQRGSARRHPAPVQRRHQDRILRDPRQHRPAAVAKIDADAHRGGGLQQRHRERRVRPDLQRSHPHREPDLRLPAAGQFRRQQLLHDDLPSGSRYPRRVAFRRRFSVARRRVRQFLGAWISGSRAIRRCPMHGR